MMGMSLTAPNAPVESGAVPLRKYNRPTKPTARAVETGVSTQEAIEFAINFAKEQNYKQGRESDPKQPGTDRKQQLSGTAGDKHYYHVTKSQPGELSVGVLSACLKPHQRYSTVLI